jgi:Ca-activated chloride channel family protein
MRFLWPDLLWLLLFVPALVAAYFYILHRKKKTAVRYTSLLLIKNALGPAQRLRRHVPPFLFLLAITAALLAVARPSATVVLPAEYLTLVLAMDVSRSMQATDVEPTRITAAQGAAKNFIDELPSNVRLGIVTFAGTAAVVQTPTESRPDMIAAIERFQLQRGTATGSGLILALAMLFPQDGIDLEQTIFRSSSRYGARALPSESNRTDLQPKKPATPVLPGSYTGGSIILLSDGRRTTGPDPLEAAKMAADRGVRVYTVGFGTTQGAMIGDEGWSFYARLDEPTLKAVAQMTGGEYFQASSAADLRKVYENLSMKFAMERQETEISALLSAVAALLTVIAATLSVLWFRRG